MKHCAALPVCVSFLLIACAPGPQKAPPTPMVPPTPMATPDAGSMPPSSQPPVSGSPDAAATSEPNPPPPPAKVDAGGGPTTPPMDGGSVVVTPPTNGAAPKGPFTCTLVLGISATGDWFNAGFEKVVDGNRWELRSIHNAFVNNWADPNDPLWNSKPSSACTMNADNPDRIIIESLYLHWMDATLDQWMAVLEKFVATTKAKFSNLRNVELSAFVRSPTDMPCPGNMPFKSLIRPEQDMADAMMAAKYPDFVTVAPVIRVDSCGDYNGNPPHFTNGASAAKIAAKVGAVYKDRQ